MKAQELSKNMVSMKVFAGEKARKHSIINREELKYNLMDQSDNYRLKVEDQNLMQFHSSKSK